MSARNFLPIELFFEQKDPDTMWRFPFSGQNPVVDVYIKNDNGEDEKVIPNKVVSDDTVLYISFLQPQSGYAKIFI
jgi:hypothetical protein